jgi:hypothetical protein
MAFAFAVDSPIYTIFNEIEMDLIEVILKLMSADVRSGDFCMIGRCAMVCKHWLAAARVEAERRLEQWAQHFAPPAPVVARHLRHRFSHLDVAPYAVAMVGAMRLVRHRLSNGDSVDGSTQCAIAVLASSFRERNVKQRIGINPLGLYFSLAQAVGWHMTDWLMRYASVVTADMIRDKGLDAMIPQFSDDAAAALELLFGGLRYSSIEAEYFVMRGAMECSWGSQMSAIVQELTEVYGPQHGYSDDDEIAVIQFHFSNAEQWKQQSEQRRQETADSWRWDVLDGHAPPVELDMVARGLNRYVQARDNPLARVIAHTDRWEDLLRVQVDPEMAQLLRRYKNYYECKQRKGNLGWEQRARRAMKVHLGTDRYREVCTQYRRIVQMVQEHDIRGCDPDAFPELPNQSVELIDSEAESDFESESDSE